MKLASGGSLAHINHRFVCVISSPFFCRMNIVIFGSLLKNAVFTKDCWFIVRLLDEAVKANLSLDEKAVRLLDQFKNDTMEKLVQVVIILTCGTAVICLIRVFAVTSFRIAARKYLVFTRARSFGRVSKNFAWFTSLV